MSSTIMKCAAAASLLALLSACGGGVGGLASSPASAGIGTVSNGVVNVSLSSELNDSVSDPDVGLVAFVTGTNTGRGTANAVSGIQPGATVGSTVTNNAVVTYNARYKYGVIDDITRTSSFISGDRAHSSTQNVTLTADFGAGSLTGTTADLDVNGTISGRTLGGTVDVTHSIIGNAPGTVSTNLQGEIGSTGVIGAFAGLDNDTVVAGGFVGEP